MASYLIEFRLSGQAKRYTKQLAYDIAEKFGVKGLTKNRVVPHVTLVGGFSSENEERLIDEFEETANNCNPPTIGLDGFRYFGNRITGNRVVAINIEPSPQLSRLREDLINRLNKYCKLGEFDKKPFKPHITLAFKDIDKKFNEIKKYVESIHQPLLKDYVLRVALLKNAKILCEYDFFQRRLLTRKEALDINNKKTTLRFLKWRYEGKDLGCSPSSPLILPSNVNVFLVSDLHFDHSNIIRYCNRPFHTTQEMNSSLIRNWNYDVSPSDIVLILGDLTFGPKHRPADYWLEKLNGQKFYLRGNHEIDPINKAVEIPNQYFIRFNQQTFMLTHKPLRPATWDSWIIHGHEHNNHPAHYPFINHSKKTINVSIEVIDYHPISINRIIQGITPTKSA